MVKFLGVLLRNNYTNMNKGLSSVASSHFDNDAFYVLIINSIFNWNCNGQNKSSLQKELSISLLFYMSFASIYTDQAKIFNPCYLFSFYLHKRSCSRSNSQLTDTVLYLILAD